jgi:glutathione S-transferase
MSLTLHYHPLSSYCQKVLIALYENGTPFKPHLVDLGDAASVAAFKALWPIGNFPVLRDDARDWTVPESSIIIEYLAQHYPGPVELVARDPETARQERFRDRFFDLYIMTPMQQIVGDRLRPANAKDPFSVDRARAQLNTALGMLDRDIATKTWAMGERFGMADCAAAPALYYVNLIEPLAGKYGHVAVYLDRLMRRASFARAVKEADPYRHLFPKE